MDNLKLGKYKHYKGREYEVIGFAKHSETLEDLVVYKTLYDSKEFGRGKLWVRPVDMFMKDIEVHGIKQPRFEYTGE